MVGTGRQFQPLDFSKKWVFDLIIKMHSSNLLAKSGEINPPCGSDYPTLLAEGSAQKGEQNSERTGFPYGILVVVAIGVTLGVFSGGLLLTLVLMYMKR